MWRSHMYNLHSKPSLQACLRERFIVQIHHGTLCHVTLDASITRHSCDKINKKNFFFMISLFTIIKKYDILITKFYPNMN